MFKLPLSVALCDRTSAMADGINERWGCLLCAGYRMFGKLRVISANF